MGSISYAYWGNDTACIRVSTSFGGEDGARYAGLPAGEVWNINEAHPTLEYPTSEYNNNHPPQPGVYVSPHYVGWNSSWNFGLLTLYQGVISVSLRDYAPTRAGECTVYSTLPYCIAK